MSFVEKFETLCEELQIMAADGELSREDWAKTNLRSNMYVTSLPGSPNADRWNACAFAIARAAKFRCSKLVLNYRFGSLFGGGYGGSILIGDPLGELRSLYAYVRAERALVPPGIFCF